MVEIRPISREETEAIREQMLRPTYPLDWHEDSRHFGAFDGETLVAICSLYHENPQEQLGQGAYRIRSLATLPSHRGRGLARALLEEAIAYARHQRAHFVWTNGRSDAAAFYARCGFIAQGSPNSLPGLSLPYIFRKDL